MSKRKGDNEQPEVTAEGTLAPQLGSDPAKMASQLRYDVDRLTKIGKLQKIAIAYFKLVPTERGGNWARIFCENYENLAMSEDGWRTNKIIQAIAGSKGAPTVGELMKKPGILQRNLTNRDWQKKAEEEGKVVVE